MSADSELTNLETLLRTVLPDSLLSDPVVAMLAVHMRALLEQRGKLNLTAIHDPAVIAVSHFADSLISLQAWPELRSSQAAADIGPGGGFPLLPLAAALPDCHWHGIESVGKKCRFLQQTAQLMGLQNVTMHSERAEEAGRGPLRGALDLVTARAVGPVTSLLEVSLPLLRPGGIVILYKTEGSFPEWEQALPVFPILQARALDPYRYQFSGDRQGRVLLRAQLTAPVPDTYPRAAGIPFHKPLSA